MQPSMPALGRVGRPNLNLRDAAVSEELYSVHVAAFIGSEEDGDLAHFIGSAEPLQRHARPCRFSRALVVQTSQSGRIDVSGTKNVDPESPALEIYDPGAGERTHSRFAGVVDPKRWKSLYCGDGPCK